MADSPDHGSTVTPIKGEPWSEVQAMRAAKGEQGDEYPPPPGEWAEGGHARTSPSAGPRTRADPDSAPASGSGREGKKNPQRARALRCSPGLAALPHAFDVL